MALRRRRGRVGIATDGFNAVWNVLFVVAFFAAGGYGVYYAIGKIKERADADVANTPANPILHPHGPRSSGGSSGRSSSPPPPAAYRTKPQLDQLAAEVNLAVMAKEAARYADDSTRMSNQGAAAINARSRFLNQAAGETDQPQVLEPGDEIVALEDINLLQMKPDAAASFLNKRIERIPGGTHYKVRVKRGAVSKDVYLYFAQSAGVGMPAGTRGRVKISNELALDIQKEVLSLPPNELSRPDRQEIERLLGQGEATQEEYAMLLRRLARDAVTNLDRAKETVSFADQIRKLELMMPTAPVTEGLITKDGRRFAGTLTGETQSTYTVRTSIGEIPVDRDQIKQVFFAKDLREEFDRRLARTREMREALPALLSFTREWDMPVHREYVAYLMLQNDPDDRTARLAAGYYQGANGRWELKSSIASGAPLPGPKATTRVEMKQELETMGFVLQGDRWFKRAAWSTGISSLHDRHDLRVSFAGTSIKAWHEGDNLRMREYNPTGKPADGSPPRLRFIAPDAAQGTATVYVDAPGEIQDLQVRATGDVVEKGVNARIEVFLAAEGGKPVLLYDLTFGGNPAFHDVSAHVKGKRKFSVTARMTTKVDKFHTYSRFLTCLPETKEVFWARGTILKPAPEVDKAWSSMR